MNKKRINLSFMTGDSLLSIRLGVKQKKWFGSLRAIAQQKVHQDVIEGNANEQIN